jgi:hypothetical protein
MSLARLIIATSIIIWLFPPFRQLKGGYFFYFLILGYSDPIVYLFIWLFKIYPIYTHLFLAFLLAISVLFYNKKLNNIWVGFGILLLISSLYLCNKNTLIIPIIIFRFVIIEQILITAMNAFLKFNRINIYFIILLFYEITVVLKYSALGLNYSTGIYLYYFTTASELLICFYFIFYNIHNSPLIRLPFSNSNE